MKSEPLITYRRLPATLKRSRLEKFARVLRDDAARGRAFHCLVTGDAELRLLNWQFRGKDATTDVLSFPSGEKDPIGDIAVSLGRARAQAKERGHSIEEEVCILMLHGVLHLLGMDHETDSGQMARTEVRWQRKLGLPTGLIEAGIVMILLVLIVLVVAIALFTTIQTLFVESMRLRTRDLPSLSYFKETIEPKLKIRSSEEGALTFSLWKHTCLVVMGILVLVQVEGGAPIVPVDVAEALLAGMLLMAFSAYLIPQILYQRSSGHWMLATLPFLRVAALVVRPFVAALNVMHSVLDIVKPEPEGGEATTTAENIDTLITAGTEEGLIEEDDRKLIESVIAFGDKVVREVMTPRPNVITIRAGDTLAQLHELVVHEQFSRIPVCETSIDDIVGFVHVRDMFEVAEKDRLVRTVRELMRPIRLVPETKSAHDLLREMQQEGAHMVIVVDEYGNTAGLATMEDLVEVILGEIRDEHEPDSDVKEDGSGGFIVSGNFDLTRMAVMLDYHVGEEIESTTIGGLITEWLGHVPKAGEAIEREGLRAEVLASDDMRVVQVRLTRVPEVVQ